jgi:heavy metal sensor kinase
LLAVSIVLTFALRSVLYDQARTKIDRIAADIVRSVGPTGGIGDVGDALPIDQELIRNLDHWSSPTTYLEVDNARGAPEGKSSNVGSVFFTKHALPPVGRAVYAIETLGARRVLVRTEFLSLYDNTKIALDIGEDLDIYDQTLDRVRALLAIVALVSSLVVIVASFALARNVIRPIERLIAAMRAIRSDRLDERLGWSHRRDELGALANTFDDMLDRLEDGFARERQFISDASHELKTPLTIINANAQMLERWADRDPDVRADSLRAIRDESGALARMVNGMLTLARAESGADDLPRSPVDLGSLLSEVVKYAEPRALDKGLALRYVAPTTLAIVLGDENLLRQIFTNLVDNAVKFTERGSVEVVVVERAPTAPVAVEVRDTGIGIDEPSLERIFDRFYRTDKSRDRNVPGTGLGLAIVRSIARVHGGSVEAKRNAEGGTTFVVTLPALT